MGIFDDFEYKENYQDEEKVIEVLKKILRAIHLNVRYFYFIPLNKIIFIF